MLEEEAEHRGVTLVAPHRCPASSAFLVPCLPQEDTFMDTYVEDYMVPGVEPELGHRASQGAPEARNGSFGRLQVSAH